MNSTYDEFLRGLFFGTNVIFEFIIKRIGGWASAGYENENPLCFIAHTCRSEHSSFVPFCIGIVVKPSHLLNHRNPKCEACCDALQYKPYIKKGSFYWQVCY